MRMAIKLTMILSLLMQPVASSVAYGQQTAQASTKRKHMSIARQQKAKEDLKKINPEAVNLKRQIHELMKLQKAQSKKEAAQLKKLAKDIYPISHMYVLSGKGINVTAPDVVNLDQLKYMKIEKVEDIPEALRAQLPKEVQESIVAQKQRPEYAHRITGNVGFMLGMWMEMQMLAAYEGDPAAFEAANSAFGELGGWLSIMAFAMASEKTGQGLGWLANATQSRFLGPSMISSLSMVGGSLVNSAFSKFWYAPTRPLMWRDAKGMTGSLKGMFKTLNFTDLEIYGWGQKAQLFKEKTKLRSELLKKVLRDHNDYEAVAQYNQVDKEIKELQPQIEVFREKFWTHAKKIFEGVAFSQKAVEEQLLHVTQLVVVAGGLGLWRQYVTGPLFKSGRKNTALYARAYVEALRENAAKLPMGSRPFTLKVVDGAMKFYNAFGIPIGNSFLAKEIYGMSISALHAVAFLGTDQLLAAPVFKTMYENTWLYRQDVKSQLFQVADDFINGVDKRKEMSTELLKSVNPQLDIKNKFDLGLKLGLNKAPDFAKTSIDENNLDKLSEISRFFIETWNDYINKTILFDFNQSMAAWQKRIDIYNKGHSKIINYTRWFKNSYLLGRLQHPEEAGTWLNMDEESFKQNNNTLIAGSGWHEDIEYPEFQEEVNYFRKIYKDHFGAYQLQQPYTDDFVKIIKNGELEKLSSQELHKRAAPLLKAYMLIVSVLQANLNEMSEAEQNQVQEQLGAMLGQIVSKSQDSKIEDKISALYMSVVQDYTDNETFKVFKVSDQEIEEKVEAYLKQKQLDYETNIRLEAQRIHRYLNDKLEEAFYKRKEPTWLKLWGWLTDKLSLGLATNKFNEVYRGTSTAYNLKDALRRQYDSLTIAYRALFLKDSEETPLVNKLNHIIKTTTIDSKEAVDLYRDLSAYPIQVRFRDEKRQPLKPLTEAQKKDAVAFQFARLFSYIWTEYQTLEVKKSIMLKNPDDLKAPGMPLLKRKDVDKTVHITDPFSTDLSMELRESPFNISLNGQEKLDIRELANTLMYSAEQNKDIDDMAGEFLNEYPVDQEKGKIDEGDFHGLF